ncbi:MAG: DNA methyltransferase [Phycisphaerales bacterium]
MSHRFELHHGDCLRVLPSISRQSVDLVLTDPPYGIAYHSKRARAFAGEGGGRSVLNDERPFLWFLREAAEVLKSPGALICFCRWDVQEAWRVAIDAAGLDVRGQVVWDRVQHGTGDVVREFAPQHDVMWFATKGPFTFPGRRPKSVIAAIKPHHTASVHPTEKPVALLIELIETLCPAGGTVLDCFAGSCSTGEAAIKCGRAFIGIELDDGYVRLGRQRLGECVPLFGGGG